MKYPAIGISPYFKRGGLSPYVSAFITRVNAEGGSVTANEISYLNTFANSVDLSEFDRLWIHGLSNQVAARVSLVNAATADLITEVNAPTWTASKGYTGNGTTMYLNTNYNPSADGVNFILNDCSYGLWVNTNTAGVYVDIGVDNGAGSNCNHAANIGGTAFASINNAVNNSGANANTIGFYQVVRTGANNVGFYKNAATIQTRNDSASVSVPNFDFYILSGNSAGVATLFTNRQVSLAYVGSGSYDVSSFNSAVQALAASLGW